MTQSLAERTKRTSWGGRILRGLAQLRIKITLPYLLLAVIVAFAAAFLVTRLLSGMLEDRFQTVLLDAGHKVTDTVVYVEREHLAAWRDIAYTKGLDAAVTAQDRAELELLVIPKAVNAEMDVVEVFDDQGRPLLTLGHQRGGGVAEYAFDPVTGYDEWDIVRTTLAGEQDAWGDKYADLVQTARGWTLYTAGPIVAEHTGETVGVLLVGTYLDKLVQRLSEGALADVSIYVGPGAPMVTTLAPETPEVLALSEADYARYLALQQEMTSRRDILVNQRAYAEVFGAFEVRHGEDLGVVSVALPLSFVTDAQHPTRQGLLVLFGGTTALVILIGALTASAVVRRVHRLASATRDVAEGNLETQVTLRGYDEVAELADDFNRMVIQLRDGRLYRDLLGHTTSPVVAAKLRDELARGQVKLQAQTVTASILFADIRGFTALSEGHEPAYIIEMLNTYLRGLVSTIRQNNGVVNKFVGDAVLAFFGVLPEAKPSAESAQDAVRAATALLGYVRTLNHERTDRGELPIRLGIGVNSGTLVAGLVGSEERFEYTVIGDAVNVTQRLSDLNKVHPEYDLFIEGETWHLLGEEAPAEAVHLGEVQVKGRQEPVDVYAVREEALWTADAT